MYPTKHLTVQQVIYPLKEKGIPYDGYLRCKSDGIRGCYLRIKVKYDNDGDDQEDRSSLDCGVRIATDYRALCEQALLRINTLEAGTKT